MDSDWKRQLRALNAARMYINGLLQTMSDGFIGHSHELVALSKMWEEADKAVRPPPDPNEDRLWWLRDELREVLKREPTDRDLRDGLRRCVAVNHAPSVDEVGSVDTKVQELKAMLLRFADGHEKLANEAPFPEIRDVEKAKAEVLRRVVDFFQ